MDDRPSRPRATNSQKTSLSRFTWVVLIVAALSLLFARHESVRWDHVAGFFGLYLTTLAIIAPIILRPRLEQSAEPNLVPIDADDPAILPDENAAFGAVAAQLEPLGFQVVGRYGATYPRTGVSATITLFRKRDTGNIASLMTAKGRASVVSSAARHLTFSSVFDDGTEVHTSNRRMVMPFPRLGPPIYSRAFPSVVEAADLYAVHRAHVDERMLFARQIDPIGNDPYSYQVRIETRFRNHLVSSGYYEQIPSRRTMRPTWKGAYLITFKSMWPVTSIRKLWIHQRAGSELRRLGFTPGRRRLAESSPQAFYG